MITRTVDVAEAQSQLPALIELALAGTEVVIAEGDKPLPGLFQLLGDPTKELRA